MRAIVLIPFYDKVAKADRKKGEIIEVSANRFNEITRQGRYVEAYEASAPVADAPKEKK